MVQARKYPNFVLIFHGDLFSRDPAIIDLGVWTATGAPEITPKGGALRALPFGVLSGAPGAIQTVKIDDFRVRGGRFS